MRLHHVVFCVRPENQQRAAGLWRELGLQFQEVPLEDLGVRVLIDWNAGIEIISPTDTASAPSGNVCALDQLTQGLVLSVAVPPDDVAADHGVLLFV